MIVDELMCDVIAYGLRSDFKAEPFEGSVYLMTWADEIEELKTICKYGNKASMNMRLYNDIPVFDGNKVMIGGNDSYLPVCRTHYKKNERKYMEILNTHPIKKSDLGFHGNLFGGKLLAWIDASAAGICNAIM